MGVSIVDIPGVTKFHRLFKLNTQSVLNPLHKKTKNIINRDHWVLIPTNQIPGKRESTSIKYLCGGFSLQGYCWLPTHVQLSENKMFLWTPLI